MARRHMWDVIQSIAQKRQGSAVILTTHSMEEADALCSRIRVPTETLRRVTPTRLRGEGALKRMQTRTMTLHTEAKINRKMAPNWP